MVLICEDYHIEQNILAGDFSTIIQNPVEKSQTIWRGNQGIEAPRGKWNLFFSSGDPFSKSAAVGVQYFYVFFCFMFKMPL